MSEWFVNGERVDGISPDNRATQYGDGVFETIAIRNGDARLWQYHVERLQTGCVRLGIPAPGTDLLAAALASATAECETDTDRATAKILVVPPAGPRGYRRSSGTENVLIGLFESSALPANPYREGVTVRVCATRLAIQPQLAGIKSLNRLEQILARNEWQDRRIFEGLTLDTDDRLICGTMSNVFLVTGQSLITPAITRCGVSGVMRRHVLTLAEEAGTVCEVRDVMNSEMERADGVFLTNSQFGILPVRACGRLTWDSVQAAEPCMSLLAASGLVETGA